MLKANLFQEKKTFECRIDSPIKLQEGMHLLDLMDRLIILLYTIFLIGKPSFYRKLITSFAIYHFRMSKLQILDYLFGQN